jgi:hypothetical protein
MPQSCPIGARRASAPPLSVGSAAGPVSVSGCASSYPKECWQLHCGAKTGLALASPARAARLSGTSSRGWTTTSRAAADLLPSRVTVERALALSYDRLLCGASIDPVLGLRYRGMVDDYDHSRGHHVCTRVRRPKECSMVLRLMDPGNDPAHAFLVLGHASGCPGAKHGGRTLGLPASLTTSPAAARSRRLPRVSSHRGRGRVSTALLRG